MMCKGGNRAPCKAKTYRNKCFKLCILINFSSSVYFYDIESCLFIYYMKRVNLKEIDLLEKSTYVSDISHVYISDVEPFCLQVVLFMPNSCFYL